MSTVFLPLLPILLSLGATDCQPNRRSQSPVEEALSPRPSLRDELSKQAKPAPAEEPQQVDLREFEPILVSLGYQTELNHIQNAEFAEASKALEQRMQGPSFQQLSPINQARLSFTLASVEERAALDQASQSYIRASKYDWPLKGFAALRAARLLVQAENYQDVPQLLQLAESGQEVTYLRAALLEHQGKSAEALALYAQVKEGENYAAALRARAQILLALAQAEKQPKARAQELLTVVRLAQKRCLGCSDEATLAGWEAAALKLGALAPTPNADGALDHLEALVDARKTQEGQEFAAEMLEEYSFSGYDERHCRFDLYRAKLLTFERKWGEASDRILGAAEHCKKDLPFHAALLFNAGKFHAADGRHTKAVAFYAELEQLHQSSTLTDDSRLRRARSYLKMGAKAPYISLLSSIADDYPEGDMTMEGVLELALYQIERDEWSSAGQVLEHAAAIVGESDSARGHEFSGTERYFLARVREQLGRKEEALALYEELIAEIPLSYYMLQAFSQLYRADKERALRAVDAGMQRAHAEPFSFPHRKEYLSSDFQTAMEFLRVGESEEARAALDRLGLDDGLDNALLWGVALLYDRAGDAHVAHRIARGKLTDWFAQYPAGDWRAAWEIAFPRPYLKSVEKEAARTGVDPFLIYGVMREESTFEANVVSHAAAYGLMQVIEPTARGIGRKYNLPYSVSALTTPRHNIALGSHVLKDLTRRFSTNPLLAIPGYNAGPGRPIRWLRERPNLDFDFWIESIPIRETRRYIKRVLTSRAAYAFIYYERPPEEAFVLPQRLSYP